ncbi:MAG: hypothetical protein F4121_09440 [Acidimicrobiia bacterium]|nr:hypothetical protein [Acidimicrobiia bacterium]MYC44063.1 hypothetical protein [Acidimicrobiia bacterium]MYI20270.1 hypothetical protein [Acidimicrobiia bacterium]
MTETDVKTAVLHRKIAEHMDTETADALIERLPPDWEQLVTKTDLARLGADLGGKITALAAAMESMEGRLERRAARDLRTVLFAFAGFALAVMGMFTTILVAGVPAAG